MYIYSRIFSKFPTMNQDPNDWKNTLVNGLVYPERKNPAIASGMWTKPLPQQQLHDMKHDRFEIIANHERESKLRFDNKRIFRSHRSVSFMPQE